MPLEIIDSIPHIEQLIFKGMVEDLNKAIPKALNNIKIEIIIETGNLFVQTDIYRRLVSGDLKTHFGLTEPVEKLDEIIQNILLNINVSFRPLRLAGTRISGGITVGILQEGFKQLFALTSARQITEKGEELPWLEWLLIRGNEVIIQDYDLKLEKGQGRTGEGFMIFKTDGVWRVPIDAAGVERDNWLTRALLQDGQRFTEAIGKIIIRNIEKAF